MGVGEDGVVRHAVDTPSPAMSAMTEDWTPTPRLSTVSVGGAHRSSSSPPSPVRDPAPCFRM